MARKRKAQRPWRSKFEEMLGRVLDGVGVAYGYETETFKIIMPAVGHRCAKCGSKLIERPTRYTPDFFLPRGRVVEAKGRFTGRDRKKALAFMAQYPKRPFALLFMRDNKLSKKSETYYSDWCEANSVPYSIGTFKPEWLK